MPYVSVSDSNRYLGEHTCHLYHYGDESVVRPCCVKDALARKENAQRVALTRSHPAVTIWLHAWNSLTTAEMALVGEPCAWEPGTYRAWLPDDTWR